MIEENCTSIFKGQNKEEICTGYNQKWVQIINLLERQKWTKIAERGLQAITQSSIIDPIVKQFNSVNPKNGGTD